MEGLDQLGVKYTVIDVNIGVDIDMGPIVTRAMALNVDGYYLCTFGMDTANILKALSDRGMHDGWRVLAGGQAMGAEIFSVAKNYNENVYFWELFNLVNNNPEFQNYVKDYGAAHDGAFPYTWANWGFYYAVKAFAAAIATENVTGNPAKLAAERVAIRDFFWDAKAIPGFGSDTFSYGDEGRILGPLYMYQTKNNQFTIVGSVVDISANE
jgi:ABC-type branched-subunit amino acid transport system substrate-binding protein